MNSPFSWRGLRLRVPAGRQAQRLSFPVSGPIRIALLEKGFCAERNVREFDAEDIAGLRSYAPEALVAPLDVALSLADQRSRGLIDLSSLNVAIVVLTSLDDSPLTGRSPGSPVAGLWRPDVRTPAGRGWDGNSERV